MTQTARRAKPSGPLVVFKTGDFGARLFAEFFGPSSAALVRAFALEAPPLKGGRMIVTEVWRKPRRTGDAHYDLRAVDVRTGVEDTRLVGSILGSTRASRYEKAETWAARVAKRLGSEYDVVFGEAVRHVDHIHGEHDSRKRRRTFVA